jgi:hypothetical protein
MASPFIFLYSLFFLRGFKEKKFYNFIIALIILGIIIFIYPITVLFLLVISFIYFIFYLIDYRNIDWNLVKKIIMIGLIGAVLSIALFLFLKIPFSVFHFRVWTDPSINYSLFYIYGFLPSIFAILGLFYLSYKKKNMYLISWFVFGIFSFYFYKIFKFMFLIPYEREIYLFILGLPIYTAYGFGFFNSILKKKDIKLKSLIFVIILVITLLNAFYNYHSFNQHKYYDFDGVAKNLSIYHCVSNEDNFILEVSRCIYPNYHNYTHYLKDG